MKSKKKIGFSQWSAVRTGGIATVAAASLAGCLLSTPASAGGTITFGEDKSVSVGLGLRSSVSSVEGGAANGTRAENISLDSVRIYMGGSLNKYIKGTFNTEVDGDGDVNLLDAYAQFEFADEINFWVGRMLPPSDRANLDGPYYLNTWQYPGVVSQYPAKFAGRDDGATVWGKLIDKKLVYAVGVFKGHNRFPGASNVSSSLLFAGRVAFNFLDPEANPAYYTSSTYYGSADVLTLAVAGMHQSKGVGTALLPGDYTSWSADLLFEKPLGDVGTVTLEGAYYDYGTDSRFDVAPGFGGSSGTSNVGGIAKGTGVLVGAAYLFPGKMGVGMLQPAVRFQLFENDLTGVETRSYDVGVNYIIDAHNARLSLNYSVDDTSIGPNMDKIILGVQLQF